MSDWLAAISPLVIGHRGASTDAPENSLAAFSMAAEQDADGIELDVRLSADGWPVVMHDKAVDRATNGSGYVSDLTVKQLLALEDEEGQHVPTLDQVFETFGPTLLYNVEIKEKGWVDRGLAATVADRIESHQLENRVLVSSFNPITIRRARKHLSYQTYVALIRVSGLARYTYLLTEAQADHPHFSMVSKQYMHWAYKKGYRFHVWTVDDPTEAVRLANLGVHSIITNKPRLIRGTLSSR
jgi:glycerophosphoryl diester phosphodiesterase